MRNKNTLSKTRTPSRIGNDLDSKSRIPEQFSYSFRVAKSFFAYIFFSQPGNNVFYKILYENGASEFAYRFRINLLGIYLTQALRITYQKLLFVTVFVRIDKALLQVPVMLRLMGRVVFF